MGGEGGSRWRPTQHPGATFKSFSCPGKWQVHQGPWNTVQSVKTDFQQISSDSRRPHHLLTKFKPSACAEKTD